MPQITIIIPIYNASKYMRKSIESALSQTVQDIEVILIDDGSTDNSYKICCEYKEKDIRVKLIKQNNQGVSTARNAGLTQATGKYIMFFDSDDYASSNMAEEMIKLIGDNEMAISGVCKIDVKGNRIFPLPPIETYHMSHWEAISSMYKDRYFSYQGYIWNKLYRRDIIEKYSIKFREDLAYNEDRTYNVEYLTHCNNIIATTKTYYSYTVWPGSTMNNNVSPQKATTFNAFEIQQSLLQHAPIYIKQLLAQTYVNELIDYTNSSQQDTQWCKTTIRKNIKLLKGRDKLMAGIFTYSPFLYRKMNAIIFQLYKLKKQIWK